MYRLYLCVWIGLIKSRFVTGNYFLQNVSVGINVMNDMSNVLPLLLLFWSWHFRHNFRTRFSYVDYTFFVNVDQLCNSSNNQAPIFSNDLIDYLNVCILSLNLRMTKFFPSSFELSKAFEHLCARQTLLTINFL